MELSHFHMPASHSPALYNQCAAVFCVITTSRGRARWQEVAASAKHVSVCTVGFLFPPSISPLSASVCMDPFHSWGPSKDMTDVLAEDISPCQADKNWTRVLIWAALYLSERSLGNTLRLWKGRMPTAGRMSFQCRVCYRNHSLNILV